MGQVTSVRLYGDIETWISDLAGASGLSRAKIVELLLIEAKRLGVRPVINLARPEPGAPGGSSLTRGTPPS
jgi:hypothetical protein